MTLQRIDTISVKIRNAIEMCGENKKTRRFKDTQEMYQSVDSRNVHVHK